MAVDLSSSDTLMSFNPQLPTATASTTKLFSTAMALELLGPEYRFETTLFTDGLIDKGVLKGNLWIKGGGDVSFGSKFFNGEGKEFEEIDDISFQFLNAAVGKMTFGIKELKKKCSCGEEVHTDMQFPNGASGIFVIHDAFEAYIKE